MLRLPLLLRGCRGRLVLAPILFMYLFLCSAVLAQESLPDTVASVKPSVVLIVTYNRAGKPLAAGSGFCIAAGRIVTNNHVISGAARITIRLGTGGVYAVKRVLVADKDLDLAILETGLDISQIVPLQLTSALPREGERLFVVSNPEGLTGSVSDGIVSAIRRFTDGSIWVQITAPISHGSSGGPVLNLEGQVVGVAVASFKQGQNLNFMIPAAAVARLSARISAPAGAVHIIDSRNVAPATTVKVEPLPTFPKPEIRERSSAEARRLFSEGVRIRHLSFSGKEQNKVKLQAAISYFENAIQIDPNLAEGWRELAMTEMTLGRFRDERELFKAKATAILTKAIEFDPDQYETYALLARILSKNLSSALSICAPLVKRGKAGAFLCLGGALEGAGNRDQAIDEYRKGVQADSGDVGLLSALATALGFSHRYTEAITYWQRLVKLKPDDLEAMRGYAQCLEEVNRLADAVQIYRRIVEDKESTLADYRSLISVLYDAHQYEEAVSIAQAAVKRFPDDPQAWEKLGSAYGFTNRPQEEIAAFKKAIGLAPDRESAHSWLGSAYFLSKRYEEAIQAYLEAIRLKPYGSTYASLGEAYAKQGRYREALDSFAEAIRLDPTEPHILSQLGELYSNLGYYEKAIETYRKAIQISTGANGSSIPALHYSIGQCYLNLGNRAAALAEYKTLKAMDAEYAQLLLDSIYR
jgi:tetratricopeptide (TPR) repeat protein